jgi:hypothetical protein
MNLTRRSALAQVQSSLSAPVKQDSKGSVKMEQGCRNSKKTFESSESSPVPLNAKAGQGTWNFALEINL